MAAEPLLWTLGRKLQAIAQTGLTYAANDYDRERYQEVAEAARFSVVRDFCGHGIGQVFHSPPSVLHFGEPGTGAVLNGFKEIRDQGLCNLDLPPTLSGPIGEICGLIANERFSKLLDRVDTVTGTINTKVTNVTNKVQSILDQLPIQGDCKLFCGN